jgi:hypothetical protein
MNAKAGRSPIGLVNHYGLFLCYCIVLQDKIVYLRKAKKNKTKKYNSLPAKGKKTKVEDTKG